MNPTKRLWPPESPARSVAIRLGVLALALAAIFGVSKIDLRAANENKNFAVSDADVRIEVRPDASLRVTERLTFDFNGVFSGAFRDVPLAAGARATNVSVSEPGGARYRPGARTAIGSFDQPGSFGATAIRLAGPEGGPTAGFRVVWHYAAVDEEREFIVSYDVEGVARAYDDVVEVPWAIWGDQWEFWLDRLDAEIALEGDDSEPLKAYVEPRDLGSDAELGPGFARLGVERLAPREQIAFTALFPRDAFASVDGARVEDGDGLAEIERAQADVDGSRSTLAKVADLIGNNTLTLGIIWTALVVAVAALLYLRSRERPVAVPEYLPEPPDEAIPPALAYALAHEGDYEDRLVLATLLDLVERDYFETRPSADEELDLILSVPESRPDPAQLNEYEAATLDFFDRLLEKGPERLGKLKDRVPKHSESWRKRWQKLNAELDRAEEGELHWDRDLIASRTLLGLVAFTGYLALAIPYFLRTGYFLLPLALALIGMFGIYILPARFLRRLEPVSRERNARWAAFARWTRDFPRLEDDPPATLKLWRRILVYAVAMGTADRVIESGRIPDSIVAEAQSSGFWLLHTGQTGLTSNFTTSFDGFASGFSSHVAPQSSGGSGGFSGGGGGFSGGGGGGAW